MIKIAIICFLISISRSEKCNFGVDQINELRQLFNDSERQMENATRGQSKNAAIVLGNKRSGKSALINYLMGNASESYNSNMHTIKNGLEIGAGSVSVSTIPKKWNSIRSELQNLDIWDTDEFDDNRDEKKDLINSFHLHHLTKKVDSLKFILVINFNDIIDNNWRNMIDILSILDGYFNDLFKDIFPSISVIISEAPLKDKSSPVNFEYIKMKLNSTLLSSSFISNVSRSFILNVMNNANRLAFFRPLQSEENPSSHVNDTTIQAINNCESINKSSHQDIGFAMSLKSKICLEESNEELLNMTELLELHRKLIAILIDTDNHYCQTNDTNMLKENKANLDKIYQTINVSSIDNSDPLVQLKTIEKIDATIKTFITVTNLESKIIQTKFLDGILNSDKKTRIRITLNFTIQLTNKTISSLINFCSKKLNSTTAN